MQSTITAGAPALPEQPFEAVKKSAIVNSKGIRYTDFKAQLKPNYALVWFHISLGYLALGALLAGCAWMQLNHFSLFWLTIPVGAILTGYLIAYIHLFIHEAAHYNIAPDRKQNDRLANIFIGLIVGMDIGFYRIIHFDHHRYLGTVKDTEKTYFDALTWRFILESLTGIRVIKVMTNRDQKAKMNAALKPEVLKKNKQMFLLGALFNLAVTVTFFALGFWQVALVWLAGMGVLFPFFAALRQLLEHRNEAAEHGVDYNTIDHGVTNRMFGNGLLAATLGGAGFNRHLLHHWDPQVSYTRLGEVEKFLLDTDLAPALQQHHTGYLRTFVQLFNK